MEQSFTKGWKLENSSFTAEAFGKMLNKKTLNIQATEEKLLQAVQLEGDHTKLKKNLKALVENYQKLHSHIAEAGKTAPLLLNAEVMKKQVESLVSLQAQLAEGATKAVEQEIVLQGIFDDEREYIHKRQSENSAKIQKHRDRLGYLAKASTLVKEDAGLSYEQALRGSEKPTRAKIEEHELKKLNVRQRLLDHEKTRLDYYQSSKGNDYKKHADRITKLQASTDNSELLQNAEGEVAESLRKEWKVNTDERMKLLLSVDGFRGSELYKDKAFSQKSTSQKLDVQLGYEKDRLAAFENQDVKSQMHRVIERQLKLKTIQAESARITAVLQPIGNVPCGALDAASAAAVFENLSILIHEITSLEETAQNFDYVSEAGASNKEQLEYIMQALLERG